MLVWFSLSLSLEINFNEYKINKNVLTGVLKDDLASLGSLKQAMGVYLNVSQDVHSYSLSLAYVPRNC
jgi:hypothetical protein